MWPWAGSQAAAGAQEPVQWKPAITLSQPTPLNAAPAPAPSFRAIPGTPPAIVRGQQADERVFQIEPLPPDAKFPQALPKDKNFIPPPPTSLGPTPITPFDGVGGCSSCDDPCGTCGTCGPRLSGLRGWGSNDPGDRYQAWASAEYLMWWQKGQTTPPLIAANAGGTPTAQVGIPGAGTNVLYNQTPNYSESGGRFGIGAWLPCFCNNVGVEINYFFLARQSSTAVFNSDGNPELSRPFINDPPIMHASEPFSLQNSTDLAHGSATVHDFTQLWGIDANLRYKLYRGANCWIDALVGYRYLNLTEGIDITEDRFNEVVGTLPNTTHTREVDSFGTSNAFNGVQLGLDGECRIGDRWFIGMNAKIAMGTTSEIVNINGSTTYSGFTGILAGNNGTAPGALLTSVTNIGTWSQSRFAVAPEVGFKIGYDVTDHLRLFAGYDFLYLSSVVRPGDQIDVNVNPKFRPQPSPIGTGLSIPGTLMTPAAAGPRVPTVLLRSTDYWAQGLTFGLMYRY